MNFVLENIVEMCFFWLRELPRRIMPTKAMIMMPEILQWAVVICADMVLDNNAWGITMDCSDLCRCGVR